MLTKRDYWTITSLILVSVVLFQLISVARRNDGLDGISRGVQNVAQDLADALSKGDEER